MGYRFAADFVLIAHFGYVAFVFLGQLCILLGILCQWEWTRNLRFRIVHLTMIGIVCLETVLGITCPLTTWEMHLRRLAGQATYTGDFIANWLHELLFIDDAPPWMFTTAYLGFGATVLISYLTFPPRWQPNWTVEQARYSRRKISDHLSHNDPTPTEEFCMNLKSGDSPRKLRLWVQALRNS